MGRAVEQAAIDSGSNAYRIKGRVDLTAPIATALPAALDAGDVVIDFSAPAGTVAACRLCATSGAALVTGTTGLGPAEEALLGETARSVAVLRSTNFSLGVLALKRVVAAALAALPEDWDVEIVERHHRRKLDAPSGTALALAREVAARRGRDESNFTHGRKGRTGERRASEIGLHAVRGGSWVGDHTVLLAGEGEWLELRHVAQDRSAFARGALAAARFVATAAPGIYNLEDLATGGRS